MRLATIRAGHGYRAAVVRDDHCLPVTLPGLGTVREIADAGEDGLDLVAAFAHAASSGAWRPLAGAELGPAVPDPGAIYTIGHNYRSAGEAPDAGPPRPLVYGKAASSVGAHGATLAWDRSVTDNV